MGKRVFDSVAIVLVVTAMAAAVIGCATPPQKIAATYVSPMQFQNLECDQVIAEMKRVNRRCGELYMSLKKTADTDKKQMGVGMILFWPALFALEGGDGPEATEYARLKGEREALEKAGIQKKCDTSLFPPRIEKSLEEKKKKKPSKPSKAPAENKSDSEIS